MALALSRRLISRHVELRQLIVVRANDYRIRRRLIRALSRKHPHLAAVSLRYIYRPSDDNAWYLELTRRILRESSIKTLGLDAWWCNFSQHPPCQRLLLALRDLLLTAYPDRRHLLILDDIQDLRHRRDPFELLTLIRSIDSSRLLLPGLERLDIVLMSALWPTQIDPIEPSYPAVHIDVDDEGRAHLLNYPPDAPVF